MRIGVLVGSFSADIGGGYTFQETILNSLLEIVPNSPHQFVFYTQDKNVIDRNIPNASFKSIYLDPRERRKLRILEWLQALPQKIRHPFAITNRLTPQEQWSLNILNHDKIQVILSLVPVYLTSEIPNISIVWDLQHRLQPFFPEVSIAGEWQRREMAYQTLLQRASYIITGTEAGKQEIAQFYQVATERIRVLPLPTPQFALCSPGSQTIDVVKKYQLPKKYLFYPAQFWPHKNHINLLHALHILKHQYDLELPIVFVGSEKGNQAYVMSVAEELGLTHQVHKLGFIPVEDMAYLYKNAFALTFMSLFGPDNLPPLEAMALGCPVIASNVSGAKEQFGDNVLIVNATQPKAIATAIKSLWDDPNLSADLVQKGLSKANSWTSIQYAQKIHDLLDEFEGFRRVWP